MSPKIDCTWGPAARAYTAGWRSVELGTTIEQQPAGGTEAFDAYYAGVRDASRKRAWDAMIEQFRRRPGGREPAPIKRNGQPIIDMYLDSA